MEKSAKFYDEEAAQVDWHEKDLNNQDEPSCENCGSHDYDYHHSEQEESSNVEHYLQCNSCKEIFEASLR